MYQWGVVGSDLIAEEFIDTLLKSKHSCKLAQCRNEQLKRKYSHLVCYDSIQELFADEDIEILYISTFVNQHFDIVLEALRHGLHVIGEKPLFMNGKDAQKAYAYAEEKGLLVGEANTMLYMPIYHKIKELIDSNKIGTLKMIRMEFGSLKPQDKTSNVMQKELGGGALYDIGIYALTGALAYLNVPNEIKAITLMHPFGVDEGWNIMLQNERNQLVSIVLSLRCKLEKRFLIAGDTGYIEIMNYPRADSFTYVNTRMEREEHSIGSTQNAVLYEIESIEKMIEDKCYEGAMMKLSIQVMNIMDHLREEKMIC